MSKEHRLTGLSGSGSPALRRVRLVFVGLACILLLGCSRSSAPGSAHPPRVVLMIGDGMGVAVVTAARIHSGALHGLQIPSSGRLILDQAPRSALVRTWSEDGMVTDSAASMTAMVTGYKTRNGMLGVRGEIDHPDTLETLLEIAEARGLSTGVVTTTRITHATPAACYAHVVDRDEEETIALRLLPEESRRRNGDGVEVALGGGSRYFLPRSKGGTRSDDRDLTAEFRADGYRVAWTASDLQDAVHGGADRILGLFAPSHMAYETDRVARDPEQPSLSEMSRAALEVVDRNPKGFFLMIEGGRIDHALHDNNAYRAVTDMLAFEAAVRAVLEVAPAGTIVIVTADHDHTMVISGYAGSDRDVFTDAGTDLRGKPYTAILFGTGPSALLPASGAAAPLPPDDPDFLEQAAVPLQDETHGAMDVPLYVWGPREVLDAIPAGLDNTDVFRILHHVIAES